MGLVGTFIELMRTTLDGSKVSTVKFDQGGDDPVTGDLYQPAGFDSHPLPDDFVLAVRVPGSQRFEVIGYLDPVNDGTTQPGESRMYARDGDGNVLCTILLNDFVNLGQDVAPEFIPRDDRIQSQLNDIKANIDDLQLAHDTHMHPTAGTGAPSPPTVMTTQTYTVGDTATDKVKGT